MWFVCSCQQYHNASARGCGATRSKARVRQIGRRVYLGSGPRLLCFFFFNQQAVPKRNRGMEGDSDRGREEGRRGGTGHREREREREKEL